MADTLSRRLQFSAISSVQFSDWEEIGVELAADDRMKRVMQDLMADPDSHPGFQLQQGKLKYKGRLVLAKGSTRIPNILAEFHDSPTWGHLGYFRTYKRITSLFYWEGMRKDIQHYVQS